MSTEIRRLIALAKEGFPNLSKVLRNERVTLETKNSVMVCDIHPLVWQQMMDNFHTDEEKTNCNLCFDERH